MLSIAHCPKGLICGARYIWKIKGCSLSRIHVMPTPSVIESVFRGVKLLRYRRILYEPSGWSEAGEGNHSRGL